MQRHSIPMRGRLASVAYATSSETVAPVPMQAENPLAKPENVDTQAVQQMLATLGRMVEEFHARQKRSAKDIAQMTVELAVAMAERLLKTHIDADRQRLDRIAQHALERASATESFTIRANPQDIALLERQLAEATDADAPRSALKLVGDATYARGQMKFEADDWLVEWDTARSLAELRNALLEETW